MKLENKVIWILSPNRWGKMKVSKHHYALTLAARNNIVYFIEPPSLETEGVVIRKLDEADNLFIVSYKPVFRGQNFLPAYLYRYLLKAQVNLFRKKIPKTPDIVWDFNPYLFENLKWFKAPLNILHIMDFGIKPDLPPETKSSQIIFGVSASIVNWLKPAGVPLFFVNHGLGKAFARKGNELLKSEAVGPMPEGYRLKIGYIGNLLMEAPDRETMMQVVKKHPGIDFIFWGQYENSENNNLGSWNHGNVPEFIDFLKRAPNVVLKGSQEPEKIQNEIDNIDAFWICWKVRISSLWDGSNSHKILEYLSTGKPVIAHHIQTYKDSDLLYMLPVETNENYLQLFDTVTKKILSGEDSQFRKRRIEFALNNTYEKQVDRIEALLNEAIPASNP